MYEGRENSHQPGQPQQSGIWTELQDGYMAARRSFSANTEWHTTRANTREGSRDRPTFCAFCVIPPIAAGKLLPLYPLN